jgi:hypothetical protein
MSIETIGPFTRPAVIARGAESIRRELVTLGPYIGLDVPAVVNGSAAANVHRQSVRLHPAVCVGQHPLPSRLLSNRGRNCAPMARERTLVIRSA